MNSKKQLNDYGKYTSIAFQMLITILAGVFGGHYLDKYLNLKFPVFTVIFSFASVIISIYFVVKDLINNK